MLGLPKMMHFPSLHDGQNTTKGELCGMSVFVLNLMIKNEMESASRPRISYVLRGGVDLPIILL